MSKRLISWICKFNKSNKLIICIEIGISLIQLDHNMVDDELSLGDALEVSDR